MNDSCLELTSPIIFFINKLLCYFLVYYTLKSVPFQLYYNSYVDQNINFVIKYLIKKLFTVQKSLRTVQSFLVIKVQS